MKTLIKKLKCQKEDFNSEYEETLKNVKEILDTKILKLYQESKTYSDLGNKIEFSCNDIKDLKNNKELIFTNLLTSQVERYIKVKITKHYRNGQVLVMLSFIDCSISVLYDQERNHNELLMLVNATVSHELRNPLNSLIA